MAVARLRDLPCLAGIGITTVGSGYGVKVNLHESLPEGFSVPTLIGRVPVVVELVGYIRKL
jgi:hypothetical protein